MAVANEIPATTDFAQYLRRTAARRNSLVTIPQQTHDTPVNASRSHDYFACTPDLATFRGPDHTLHYSGLADAALADVRPSCPRAHCLQPGLRRTDVVVQQITAYARRLSGTHDHVRHSHAVFHLLLCLAGASSSQRHRRDDHGNLCLPAPDHGGRAEHVSAYRHRGGHF